MTIAVTIPSSTAPVRIVPALFDRNAIIRYPFFAGLNIINKNTAAATIAATLPNPKLPESILPN